MNFIVYFTLPSFFKALPSSSPVYMVGYSEGRSDAPPNTPAEKAKGLVLLTSDAGADGGTVRVLQITITDNGNSLELANEAGAKVNKFLAGKGLRVQEGVLLTAGLQDSLRYWGHASTYSLAELDELLEGGKDATLK